MSRLDLRAILGGPRATAGRRPARRREHASRSCPGGRARARDAEAHEHGRRREDERPGCREPRANAREDPRRAQRRRRRILRRLSARWGPGGTPFGASRRRGALTLHESTRIRFCPVRQFRHAGSQRAHSGRSARVRRSRSPSIEGTGDDPRRSARTLVDYAIAVDVADELRSQWQAAGRPAMTLGSREQDVGHPLLAELRAQQKHVADLGARLGLDPKARRELATAGWRLGQARSPDRRQPPPAASGHDG